MIRNGHRVNLRKGFWCGNASLCTSLCSLVALVASREARVRGYWSEPREGEGWTPLFFQPFNDPCLGIVLNDEVEDKVCW